MGARIARLTVAGLASIGIWSGGASTASAAGCAHPAASGGKLVCLHVGAKCQTRNANAYAAAGLACVRTRRGRRLRVASLAAQRHGDVLALGLTGRLTYRQALWDFAHTLGRLPGVRVPNGAVGSDGDGTMAVKAILEYRNRLTPAQRRAVDKVLNAPGQIVATDNPATPPPSASAAARGRPRARSADAAALQSDLTEAIARLQAHGAKFVHTVELKVADVDTPGDDAYTADEWIEGTGNVCQVTFAPHTVDTPTAYRRVVLLHELMHCAAGELVSTKDAWHHQPGFLDEGLPTWAAWVVGIEWDGDIGASNRSWKAYLATPEVSLFTRAYSGAAWWALVKHEGTDPFALLPSLVSAGSSGSPQAVYDVVRNAVGDPLVDDWGPTLGDHPEFGSPRWYLQGPGETTRQEPDMGLVDNGSKPIGSAVEPYGAQEFTFDAEADVIEVTGPMHGSGYFRDSAGTDHVLNSEPQRYCTEDVGCACPDGSELDYPIIPKGDSYIGFASEGAAGVAGVQGNATEDDPGCQGKGKKGIKVLDANDAIVASFSQGTCSLKGGVFTAHATDSGYTLDVKVTGASYGHIYDMSYGGSNPTFTLDGPGGPYSNAYVPPNPPGNVAGGVGLSPKGQAMTLGFAPTFNAAITGGVNIAGYMICKSPKKGG